MYTLMRAFFIHGCSLALRSFKSQEKKDHWIDNTKRSLDNEEQERKGFRSMIANSQFSNLQLGNLATWQFGNLAT